MKFADKAFRPFIVSCGLLSGYDVSAHTFSIEDAKQVIGAWMIKRLSARQKIAVGTILAGDFIYPSSETESEFQTEPAFHYKGMIREDATDEEAEEMLKDLSESLAASLKQKRVHVQYLDKYWILESEA